MNKEISNSNHKQVSRVFFSKKRIYAAFLLCGVGIGALVVILSVKVIDYTSTDAFCMSCHVHPHAEDNWRLSTHYDNQSGIIVHCVECHLPPRGSFDHLSAKVVTGLRDVYGTIFKDPETINWEAKRTLEAALKHTYEEACISCHQNLFPLQLSEEGMHAHLYYERHQDALNCLNCHLHVGHYSEIAYEPIDFGFSQLEEAPDTIYQEAAQLTHFERFTEQVPGTSVSFNMLPIPGGIFMMGSPKNEAGRSENEGPQRQVQVSPFFMSEIEVSWDMYMAFYRETLSEGRSETASVRQLDAHDGIDAISGPTPPWGSPDQGWGWGERPAITMTHHAAETFCRWLSQKTGKSYRLPTEAEWEFAARGNTTTPYFFEGRPQRFTSERLRNRIFGPDTEPITNYVIYRENSMARTQPPSETAPNPFGLKNMMGNVWEFCSDYYAKDAFAHYPEEKVIVNPTGPQTGTEKVIRGGSFRSDAYRVRSAVRSHTRHEQWMLTDPQIPKSIWWYSDVSDVGFRVVMEWPQD